MAQLMPSWTDVAPKAVSGTGRIGKEIFDANSDFFESIALFQNLQGGFH